MHALNVNALLDMYESPAYLEVGVQQGETFKLITATRKVAVDPKLDFDYRTFTKENTGVTCHEIPSDKYFADMSLVEQFDVIFLDGLHTFEQTLRDFTNSIERLKPGGVVIIDDVMPNSYHASLREYSKTARVRQALGDTDRAWMGDVYKLVYFIQTFFQQFSYATIDSAHSQTVVWRKMRPTVPERHVSALGTLTFEDMVLTREAYNFAKVSDIVAMVKSTK